MLPMTAAITTLAELESLYGEVGEASRIKETDRVVPVYRAFIEMAPFAILATAGPEGLDCSPRGDGPGFVRVADDRTLILPDRRGNNRIDSLRNVVCDPRVALLFMIPGTGETLRVNGRAVVCADPDLLDTLATDGRRPRTALVVTVDSVFFQCSRAVVRADLWNAAAWPDRRTVPSPGRMLAALTDTIDGEAYDAALPQRVKSTLY
jgi:PPOX class probable FMN-dependent enzyme